MLHFFRRYQKFFFLFTTIFIVASFAFFGSFQSFTPSFSSSGEKDEVVFQLVNGKKIKKSYLDHFTRFLAREEWMQGSKLFDGNYLNDGVISQDFLAAGLSEHLLTHFSSYYREDLDRRLVKEKEYRQYHHPYISTLSSENVWALFAPAIPEKLADLQDAEDSVEAFQTRIDLFLAEQAFPPAFLTQVMRYQENDHPGFPSDPRLRKGPISLFGYRTIDDWFGEKFVESVAKILMNTAVIAQKKGYIVSDQEVLSELLFKSQKNYQAISEQVTLPVSNGLEFFHLYLRQTGLDEQTVVRIWKQITLFRRMMQEVGSAALVDALPLEQFYTYAHEQAVVDLYQLPSELRFQTDEQAGLFQAYLEAVAAPNGDNLPVEYATIADIEREEPRLVGTRYRLYVGMVDKEALQAKVSTKETWDWELENWKNLQEVFPQLAQKKGTPFECLENVEIREQIDAYARAQIVNAHPEWIEEGVKQADLKESELFISSASEKQLLPGITDNGAFKKCINDQDEIVGYTQDGRYHYRILVDERAEKKEVLTFKQAKEANILESSSHLPSYTLANYLETHCQDAAQGALAQQWQIIKKEITVSRGQDTFLSLDQIFDSPIETLSSVVVDEKEGPYCYEVKQVLMDTTIPMQKWLEAQEILAKELRIQFFEGVLEQICSTNLSL